jgi:hypothetical protein
MAKVIPDKVLDADVNHYKHYKGTGYTTTGYTASGTVSGGGFPWSQYEADEGLSYYGAEAAASHKSALMGVTTEPKKSKRFENFDVVRARHPKTGDMIDAIVLRSIDDPKDGLIYEVDPFEDNMPCFTTHFCFPCLN